MRTENVECSGKFPHISRADANRSVRSEKVRRDHVVPYRCRFCRHWHVGSTIIPKRIRRDR